MGRNEFTDKDYEFDIRAIYDDPAEIQNNILPNIESQYIGKLIQLTGYLKIIVMI